jgi:hypothetical protein
MSRYEAVLATWSPAVERLSRNEDTMTALLWVDTSTKTDSHLEHYTCDCYKLVLRCKYSQ